MVNEIGLFGLGRNGFDEGEAAVVSGVMSPDGATVIPEEVRRKLGIEKGSVLEWSVGEGQAVVRPQASPRAVVELAGVLRSPSRRPMSLEEMKERFAKAMSDDDERIVREWHDGGP